MNRSLLPILACALLVPICLSGCTANRRTEQEKAVAEITKLGSTLEYETKRRDGSVLSVQLAGTQVTDAGLEHLQGLTRLQSLGLGGTQVTDAGLAHLQGLVQLQSLGLADTKITDAGLEHLQALTQLHSLGLGGTRITERRTGAPPSVDPTSDSEPFQYRRHGRRAGTPPELPQLRTLNLSKTEVTDAGLEHLKGLTQLEQLSLIGTLVTAPDATS